MNPYKCYFNTKFLTALVLTSIFSTWDAGKERGEKKLKFNYNLHTTLGFLYSVLCVKDTGKEKNFKTDVKIIPLIKPV